MENGPEISRHPSELSLYFTLSQLVTAFLNLCFCLNICFMVLGSLFFCVSKCLSSQDVAQKQEEEFRKKAAKAPWEVESLEKSPSSFGDNSITYSYIYI